MRVIPEVKRVIYDSVALGNNPYLRESFFQAEQERSIWHGIAARLATTATNLFPNAMQSMVTRPYRRKGFEVLGMGYHSVVVATDTDSVSKIHHRTLGLSPAEKADYISRLYRKQNILKEFYPHPMVCDQEFVIEPFALNPDLEAVVSKQPRQYGTFLSRSAVLDLPDFRHYSVNMHDTVMTLPDLVGKDNVIIPDGQSHPVIIDTIPIEKSDPSDFAAYHAAKSIMGV